MTHLILYMIFDISFTVTSKVEYYLCLDKFKKTKWFINGSYNSNKNSYQIILSGLTNTVMVNMYSEYSKMHENLLIWCDFNATTNEKCMEEFIV